MKLTSIKNFKKKFKSSCSEIADMNLYLNLDGMGNAKKLKVKNLEKNKIDIHYKINGYEVYISKLVVYQFAILSYLRGKNIDYYFLNILMEIYGYQFEDYKSEILPLLKSKLMNPTEGINTFDYYEGNKLWYEVKDKKFIILSILGDPLRSTDKTEKIKDLNTIIDNLISMGKELPKRKVINNFEQFIGGEF